MNAEDKRQQILQVAEQVFAENSFKGATMKQIADGVNIKTPGLYYYFDNKKELYKALVNNMYEQLRGKVVEPVKLAPDLREKIRLLAALLVDFWAERPRFPSILAQGLMWENEFTFSEVVPNFLFPMFTEIVGSLEESKRDSHDFRDVDIPLLVFNIFGMSVFYFFAGTIFDALTGEDSFTPDKVEKLKSEILDLIFRGIEKD